MIQADNGIFLLHTAHTTYALRVLPTGQLEHLYYGKKIRIKEPLTEASVEALTEKHTFEPGNSCIYDKEHNQYTLEDMCLEISSCGKGDIREPFLEIVYEDGSFSSDFVYEAFEISEKSAEDDRISILPSAYDDRKPVEHLCITMKDNNSSLKLELHYSLFEECDVITRRSCLKNENEGNVWIKRLLSTQVDFPTADYVLTSFHGAWAREMHRYDTMISAGKYVNASYTGTSSGRANPFVMLGTSKTTEDTGDCYGFNLVYSGNHYEAVEVNGYGKTRFVSGINPQGFCWQLAKGEEFLSPEAVMTYSSDGYNGMSIQMHLFVQEHIVRGTWKKKVRPVLLNSWEAAYFDINEKKLLELAKAGKEAGVELLVMDDGWFGNRDNDKSSLGDWYANRKKLPGDVKGICEKINRLGLEFGIWVEPEMVSVDSNLYREHPEWAMDIPGRNHSEGRNQRLLDLSRCDVQDYIIEQMKKLFSSANIAYVKWDMNRIITDYYSKELSPNQQGEVGHRYVLGLYRCMKTLTEAFPDILFEGCASGGNRFDLGILSYFPQIWASDDTDALCRAEIQTGYSYGYPLSTISAHVSSCPNHQTLRITPIETRFQTAAFGICGYECNLCDLKKEEREAVKEQIALYKEWREVLQFGIFYRGRNFTDCNGMAGSALGSSMGNIQEWTVVSKDRRKAVGFLMQKLVSPNTQFQYYKAVGLDPDMEYHFYNRNLLYNVKDFGDLVNSVAPVHIRQDSLMHNLLAKFVKMDGEKEDLIAFGDTLMYHGVKLKQAFGGTGYNEEVRHFPDFASRMYFMEAR